MPTRSVPELLRSLLQLEGLSSAEFAPAVCRMVAADALVLTAPSGAGRHQVVLSSGVSQFAKEAVEKLALDPASHPLLFPLCDQLHLERRRLREVPLAECLPDAEWALIGVGDSWSFCALLFGRGELAAEICSDPLFCATLLRRFATHSGSGRAGAQAASEALARLSHEFKTPLVSIKGYAELILDQEECLCHPQLRDWVRRIAGGANRLAALYRRSTAEARTEVADTYEARGVDPTEWVRRCVDEAATLASGRTLDWSHDLPADLPCVTVDPEAAQEALLELLQNAARATPDGGRVVVSAQREVRLGSDGVRVTVRDSGVGVPAGAAGEQLFERFATLSEVLGHHSGDFEYGAAGLGLGLAMARGVARAHGGELWVEARGRNPERLPGCAFHIWLARHAPVVDSTDAEGRAGRGRVLVIDADSEARQILAAALARSHTVVCVDSAAEGRLQWADGEWEACIVEPRIADGGVSLLQYLRSRPGADGAAILAYSTTNESGMTAAWRAAGVDSCVGKPARARVLLQRLRTVRIQKARR